MNAIKLLKQDHKKIRALFAEFDKLDSNNQEEQSRVVGELAHLLHAHAAVEEDIFYPEVEKAHAGATQEVSESSEEHEELDAMVDELTAMKTSDAEFATKWQAMKAKMLSHMRSEEQNMLPAADQAISEGQMLTISAAMTSKRRDADGKGNNVAG